MRDFNFFSPYLQEKRNKRQRKMFTFGIIFLVVLGLLSFSALNYYRANYYIAEINDVENYLNGKQTIEFLRKYEDVQKKYELTQEYYNRLVQVDRILNGKNKIGTALLDKMTSVLPADSKLVSLQIKDLDVTMQYAMTSMIPAAEIEHNLKQLNIFDKVYVNSINNAGAYTAAISCRLKDVSADEAKTVK